jgi:hypothetical protein
MAELKKSDHTKLICHELVIKSGLKTFMEVGDALRAIKEEKLWKADHKNFVEYCEKRWKIGKRYANNLIASSAAAKDVAQPLSEAAARELSKVKGKPIRKVVIAQATAEAAKKGRDKPSAKDVKDAVVQVTAKPVPSGIGSAPTSKPKPTPEVKPKPGNDPPEDDPVGRRIPKWIKPTLDEGRDEFNGIVATLTGVRKQVEEIMRKKHGVHLAVKSTLVSLGDAVRACRAAKPWAVCCYCKGIAGSGCKACHGTGAITQSQYKAAPLEKTRT